VARKLNTYVHVDGTRYGPDRQPPPEAAEQITNPDVWDGDSDPESAPAPVVVEAPVAPPTGDDENSGRGAGAGEDGPESPTSDPDRPRGNASREEWATYATQQGVEVTGTMGQREIRAAVDAQAAQA